MKVFIDESGDAGFKLESGSTQFFTFALVLIQNNTDYEGINDEIYKLKSTLSLSNNFEFKFQKSSHELKLDFFQSIRELPFSVRILSVDKSKIYSKHLIKNNKQFYNFMLKLVIANNGMKISDANIYLDGKSKREFRQELCSYLRTEIKSEQRIIKKFKIIESHKEPCIQIADMFAGMIRRIKTNPNCENTKQYFALTRHKIDDIWDFK